MKEFLTLYKFNFRRMINTWMIRVLAIVVLGCTLIGIIYISDSNRKNNIGVRIRGEAAEADIIVGLLNASSTACEYTEILNNIDEYDGLVEVRFEKKANGEMIEFISDRDENITSAQMEIIKREMERYILDAEGVKYPDVQVEYIFENKMSLSEEIAFYTISFILYVFILLCGSIITSSVALEKTSRVSELIVYRVSVLKLIYSKVFALYSIILLILMGAAVEFAVAISAGLLDTNSIGLLFDTVGFGTKELLIILMIIISGILVYTVLYIFVGTMIKSADQIQFSQLPVAIIVLIGFIITILCRQNADALISRICTYIPTFSPFLAVTKLFTPEKNVIEFILMGACTLIFLVAGNYFIVRQYRKENR